MPLQSNIPLQVNPPAPLDSTRGFRLRSLLDSEAQQRSESKQRMSETALKIDAERRAAANQQAIQGVSAKYGGDLEKAAGEISAIDPAIGLQIREKVAKLKTEELGHTKAELETRLAKAQEISQILSSATDDPTWMLALGELNKIDPKAAEKTYKEKPFFDRGYVEFQRKKGMTIAQGLTEAHNAVMEKIAMGNASAAQTRAETAARPRPGVDVPLPADVAAQQRELRTPQRATTPGVDVPLSPEVEAQRVRMRPEPAGRTPTPGVDYPLPPEVEAQRSRMNAQRAQIDGLSPLQFQRAQMLASNFDSMPDVKNFRETATKAKTVKDLISRGLGGPGDLALVFEFMRGLDPTSVVRESEYATAAKSGNIFAGWAAKFNGYLKPQGGFLPPQVANAFSDILQSKLKTSQGSIDTIRKDYARRIDKITGKGDGEEYLTDYGGLLGASASGPKKGDKKAYQGATYTFDGSQWVR